MPGEATGEAFQMYPAKLEVKPIALKQIDTAGDCSEHFRLGCFDD